MIIDLHLHTTRYSPCSHLTPQDACILAIKNGLDALLITEHQIQWNEMEIKELQNEFPEIKLYAGLEVTLSEGIDLVIITKNKGINVPFMISFEELLNIPSLDISKSFIFVAHLFRWSNHIEFDENKIFSQIHGIEMNSINILLTGYKRAKNNFYVPVQIDLYNHVRDKWNLKEVYNTDSHSPLCVGTIGNYLEIDQIPEDEEELISVLKTHKIYQFQNTKLLAKFLKRV